MPEKFRVKKFKLTPESITPYATYENDGYDLLISYNGDIAEGEPLKAECIRADCEPKRDPWRRPKFSVCFSGGKLGALVILPASRIMAEEIDYTAAALLETKEAVDGVMELLEAILNGTENNKSEE